MGRVSGKVAIVTGGASGLGLASAARLAEEGARVVITDVDRLKGEAAQEALRKKTPHIRFCAQDVGQDADWAAVIGSTLSDFGGLHILVNNAGVALRSRSIEAESFEDYRAIMSVNMDGVYLGIKHGIDAMRKTGRGGSIINISSIFGINGSHNSASYCASKGGVRVLTKSAALHCARSGYKIRVNSIHPGFIETPLFETVMQQGGDLQTGRRRVGAVTPMGHPGEPDDIAFGVVYLASDESKYITGTELVIDGGYLAQ